ncbi:MAG: Fe-S-containing protein [Clostridia bacterium]|nr:Fe-S-containing protein [Clostridia bacterium]
MDSVGKQAGGCNPMPISYETADDRIVIDTDELDSYAGAFAAWSGPTQ